MTPSSKSPNFGFNLLDPQARDRDSRRQALACRTVPKSLGDHDEAAVYYQPDTSLVDAVNVALAVGAPLLLTGEPGTGKTQLAKYLKHYFGIPLYPLYVRSDTTAEHLLYRFDAVAYLHSANDPKRLSRKLSRAKFIDQGPLWQAYKSAEPCVVLIDEIDKASRDFPNDLLHVLDQHEFYVHETKQWIHSMDQAPPPIVVITSNSERRLPEPFLRRCIFHHIKFDDDLVKRAVNARAKEFPGLTEEIRNAAISRFLEIRDKPIRKKPATAELLVWLAVLSAHGNLTAGMLVDCRLADLPALSTLVKDREDLLQLS